MRWLGCSLYPSTASEDETRAANVKLDTITRLARALGLTEIDLLLPDMEISCESKRGRRPPAEPLSKTEPTEFRRRFARNLRARREAAGLFQKALSNAAGMQVSAVGDIEVHATNVTLDTVTRLAQGARRKGNRSARPGEWLTATLTDIVMVWTQSPLADPLNRP